MRRVRAFVTGSDPIVQMGVAAQMRASRDLQVVETSCSDADVVVAVLDSLDESAREQIAATRNAGSPPIVLILGSVDDDDLKFAVELGIVGLVRRSEATPTMIRDTVVTAAAGKAALPGDLLAKLLRQFKSVQDDLAYLGIPATGGLTDREKQVLRMLSEGHDTRQIATELNYSERTIKTSIQDVNRRFGLKSRSHAVAYALRKGLI